MLAKKIYRRFTFQPFNIFPPVSVFFFVLSTIIGYALYLGAFGLNKELFLSELLSVGCGPSLLGSFAPNVIELGYSLGLVSLAFIFLFKYPDDLSRGLNPRIAKWMFFLSFGFVIIFLFWMMSFPSDRGFPWDLFHQVTAGIGVFGVLLYVTFDAFSAKRTRRKTIKRFVAVFGIIIGVGMAVTYLILKASSPSLTLANIFASFQFVFLGLFFFYILLLMDNKEVTIF